MVLPPSSAAQGQADEAEWLRQVRRWLTLGRKGVIVMIRDPQPARLRELVELAEALEPATKLVVGPAALRACAPGDLVVLFVTRDDLGWLNLDRPLFAQLRLRVVIWAEPEVARELKYGAPDLYDWISHFVTCPEGVPRFAVEGLRLGLSWWPGLAWRGPGLELAWSELERGPALELDAEPGHESASGTDFSTLVESLSDLDVRAAWWTGITTSVRLWRLRWALASARFRGPSVVIEPTISTPGWFPVSSHQRDWWTIPTGELRAAIARELEPEDDEPAELRDVALMLAPAPAMRRDHASPEVAARRRSLVAAIVANPALSEWSRQELAMFASLARDRKTWPDWRPDTFLFDVEHALWIGPIKRRQWAMRVAGSLGLADVVGYWSQRWNLVHTPVHRTLATELAPARQGQFVKFDEATVLDHGQRHGWDTSEALTIFARHLVERVPGHIDDLRTFISATLELAMSSIGRDDPGFGALRRAGGLALTLAGSPEHGSRELEGAHAVWQQTRAPTLCELPTELFLALVLRGAFAQASALVEAGADIPARWQRFLANLTGESPSQPEAPVEERDLEQLALDSLRGSLESLAGLGGG